MENNQHTNSPKSYKLNYKCISYSKPEPDRISYIYNRSDPNWIEIYLSEPRTDLIKEILDSIENSDYNKLFLHGGAGIGKTHLLLDAVARARLKYLPKDFHIKPNRLIFYYLINQKSVHETKIIFCDELLFSCYPILKYEQNVLNSNKLEYLFGELFQQSGNLFQHEIFWDIVKGIFSHVKTEHDLNFLIVLDQINEIRREDKKNRNKLMWMEDTLDEMIGIDIILKCASNNNETMREIYLENIENKLDENTK